MSSVDKYSIATVPLDQFFGTTHLGLATGFVWEEGGRQFLVTNWHVVTGKNPKTGRHLSATAAEPDRLRVLWHQKTEISEDATGPRVKREEVLRDPVGQPRWLVHPNRGSKVDVVAIPLVASEDVHLFPINKLKNDDLAVTVGMDIFVIGYPYGLSAGELPVWKRGSIASEPELTNEAQQYVLVDTASRPGMSGAPVIRRTYGSHLMRNGSSTMGDPLKTKFLGVYSGRLISKDPLDAQLGMMWPAQLLSEIIAGNTRDAG
jgi:hypothetical protein